MFYVPQFRKFAECLMTNDKVSLVPQLHHLLSEGKLGRIQVPVTVVCPEQALDDACWGSLPVVVGGVWKCTSTLFFMQGKL